MRPVLRAVYSVIEVLMMMLRTFNELLMVTQLIDGLACR
jgi:hypothetical protein